MNPRFLAALLLVTLTGFISLSYEICWVRLYSFITASRAWAFGAMLGTYLIGLALGSLWSLRFQDAENGANPKHLRVLSLFVLAANTAGFLVVPVVSWLAIFIPYHSVETDQGSVMALATLPLIAISAALLGATLPLICHFAISPDDKAGARLSYLYLGNILGSGAGSLLTGFVLMDQLPLQQISVLLAFLGLILSAGIAFYSKLRGCQLAKRLAFTATAGLAILLSSPFLFDGLFERLQLKSNYNHRERFDLVIESRFGVVTIDRHHKIYGGGIYDGYIGTELEAGSWMIRPYFLSAVHPAPREVLVIGLSGGTWTQILAHNPHVKHITAVEINAAYSKRVIPRYDAVKSILTDPKVEIVIDDGRRWLRNHPDRKFDAIIANATYHWREHASSLLSREFMRQIKAHLKPGGIYLFNSTGSDRAAKTALEVFPDCALLLNNIIASNAPLTYDKERWRKTLAAYQYQGKRLFDTNNEEDRKSLEAVVSILDNLGIKEVATERRLWTRAILENDPGIRKARPITDDNLGHEFWYH
ncbi:MAG: methyltransferase domain-containing protein [Verrucomicrobiales bacterium]